MQYRSLFTATILTACLLHPAHAQSAETSSACGNFTILINSLSTLRAAQRCTTAPGDIVIEYGSDLPTAIQFPLLREVEGSFLSIDFREEIRAQRLSAPNLTSITGDLYISSWVDLTTIDMPILKSTSRIRLNDLPALTNASFLASLESIENNYEVWNTSLTEITNDKLPYAIFVEIYDNPRLRKVELSALKNASYDVALKRNRPGLEVSLPELEEVWYFEVQGAASIAIPKLESAIGHFVVNMSSLERLEAPVLKTIGTWYDPTGVITDNLGLIVENCPELTNMSFPVLESVQLDLILKNNSALRTVNFPELERVTRNVLIQGSLSSVSMPELERVGAVFYLGSDSSRFDCSPFDRLKSSGGIRGDFSCPGFKEPPARNTTRTVSKSDIDSWLEWSDPEGSPANVDGVPDATIPSVTIPSATIFVVCVVVALLQVI
ncbi:hypothetical protein Dda_7316 [Drechslerella dactyloides]|uniref:Uncharacterized protein n=1 Tax=Drechslerella dactyloides TaxID=74499 RepID=A0AAD6NFH0_DREDA|nr:hypothetical protein Dda_7316 [Drechslerella dactyloides]